MLNLVQLTTFRVLAREEHFTRTAEMLDLTQPAVTQHVRGLEQHFAVKLVDIVGRRTVLTDGGRFLAERAERILGNVDALERDMREFADVRAGELRIGATVTIGTYALPDILARFKAMHPEIGLRVEVGNTAAMGDAVHDGRVSLALVEGPLEDVDLETLAFADDELILVTAPSHELATRRKPPMASDLAAAAFVSREEGSGTREQVERGLARAGVRPHVALTLPTLGGIARAVELGLGVAIVSRLAVAEAIAAGRLVHVCIRDLSFERTFRVVRLLRQTPSPAANAFTASLLGERSIPSGALRPIDTEERQSSCT